MTRRERNRNLRAALRSAGMTLIELLVVVAIVVTLLAAGVPMLQPALRDARIRESARQLNVFCTVAKGRARELGRPAGIWLDRASAGGNAVFEIHIAEQPLPYSGDFSDSVAILSDVNSDGVVNQRDILPALTPDGIPDDTVFLDKGRNGLALRVIQAGDFIQFDSQGPKFLITSIRDPGASSAYYELKIAASGGVPAALPSQTEDANGNGSIDPGEDVNGNGQLDLLGLSYTVFRQPVKSSLPSLQLAGGTVVDLEYSGIGAPDTLFNAVHTNRPSDLNATPVIIMFDTAGSVERVYKRYVTTSGGLAFNGQYANSTIHLLVGRFDQTRLPPDPTTATSPATTAEQTNLEDDSTVWISIGSRTGNVSSAENISATTVADGRLLARSAQSMGGN